MSSGSFVFALIVEIPLRDEQLAEVQKRPVLSVFDFGSSTVGSSPSSAKRASLSASSRSVFPLHVLPLPSLAVRVRDQVPQAEFTAEIGHPPELGVPIAVCNMDVTDVSLHNENFWPSISQTTDGRTFVVDGGQTSLVRVDGLDMRGPNIFIVGAGAAEEVIEVRQ